MLEIKNLHASVGERKILRNLSLEVRPGEVHAIMGPNGSGKSTLAKVLTGNPQVVVDSGIIDFEIDGKKQNLLGMAPHERARAGVFLGFQYPVEIPGIENLDFLRTTFNSVCVAQGAALLSENEFLDLAKEKIKEVGLDEDFLNRSVNSGFSGGEKKRNEILQLALLSPKLIILDEVDSGLDIDSLKTVAVAINRIRSPDNAIVLITHYKRLLDYVRPDFVHVFVDGKIAKTGDESLASVLEKQGYDEFQPVGAP